MTKSKIFVGILEDDTNYRNTLCKIIEAQENLILSYSCSKASELTPLLLEKFADILLVDIRLPDADGTKLVRKIKELNPQVKCVMCTTFMDASKVIRSLQNGADGYIIKTDSLDNIITAINDVHNGSAYMSKLIAMKLVDHFQKQGKQDNKEIECLSARENEVLELLSKGLLYKEVADELNLSIDTIKKHTSHIYRKLNVQNKTEALNKYNKNKEE